MAHAILESPCLLRKATDRDLRACGMLVPEALGWGTAPEFLIAMSESPLRFLAAAAFLPARRRSDGRPTLKIAVRVGEPHRGQGIGSRLLAALDEIARRRGMVSLSASADLLRQGGWADFLANRGFRAVDRLHAFETDLRKMRDYFVPLRDWLVERGTIPAAAEIVSLREAPRNEVARLLATHFGGDGDLVDARLNARADFSSRNLGHALLVGGEVRAALLQRVEREQTTFEAIAVEPGLRGEGGRLGWAHVLVATATIEWCASSGVRRARYDVSASNRRAMRQYLRFRPDELEIREFYERDCRSDH